MVTYLLESYICTICFLRGSSEMIKLILMDIDGVMTDGRIVMSENYGLISLFDVKDGHIIKMAQSAGLILGAISGRKSKANLYRMRELGIVELYQNCHDKVPIAKLLINRYKLTWAETAYIGDDLIDIPVLKRSGFSACPSDAVYEVTKYVNYISDFRGGRGALRQIIRRILIDNGQWEILLKKYTE